MKKERKELIERFFRDIKKEVIEGLGECAIKENGKIVDYLEVTPLAQKYYFLKELKERIDFWDNLRNKFITTLKVFFQYLN